MLRIIAPSKSRRKIGLMMIPRTNSLTSIRIAREVPIIWWRKALIKIT
jgi:hypothetical protein